MVKLSLEYEEKFYITSDGSVVFIYYKTSKDQLPCWRGCIINQGGEMGEDGLWFEDGAFSDRGRGTWTFNPDTNSFCKKYPYPLDIEKLASAKELHELTGGPSDMEPPVWREMLITRITTKWHEWYGRSYSGGMGR